MEVALEGADLPEVHRNELVPQPGGVWRQVGSDKEVHVAAATVRTHSADLDPQVKIFLHVFVMYIIIQIFLPSIVSSVPALLFGKARSRWAYHSFSYYCSQNN
jgi:hypothetical protein